MGMFASIGCGMWSLTPYDKCDFRCLYCCTKVQGTSKPAIAPDEFLPQLRQHLNDAPIPLSAILPTVSREIDSFVLRLLAKKPEHRYADMTTVMQELARWIKCDTVMRMRQVVNAPLQYSEEATSSAPLKRLPKPSA